MGIKRGSAIWLSFRKNKYFLLRNFRWSLYSGANVFLGNDLIHNGPPSHPHPDLLDFLHTRGIFTWDRLISSWVNFTPVWKEAADLSMPSQISTLWVSTRLALQGMAFKRSEFKDALLWSLPHAPLPVRVKDIYASLSISPVSPWSRFILPLFGKPPAPSGWFFSPGLYFGTETSLGRSYRTRDGKVLDNALSARQRRRQTSTCSFNAK